jgi:8-amino-7-oxononanoate synthase
MANIKTRQIDFLPSRVAVFDGKEHLFFSGTSYLGVGHQPEFRAALNEGIHRYGTVFSASRNNNLQLKIYEETELFLANWTGSDAVLTVTSGLLAGQLAVNFLKNNTDSKGNKPLFIYAPSVHPAVWEGTPQYIFKNQEDFENNIVITIEKEKNDPIVVVSNAVDMLTCQTFDFSWIAKLPDNQDITLLIDDSHGIGVTGEDGAGIFKKIKHLSNSNVKIIVIASLAKALGIPGGVILSEEKTIYAIRNNPLFVGASPIVPAYLFAFLLAQPMYEKARQTLTNNIQLFRNYLSEMTPHFIEKGTPEEESGQAPQYKSDFTQNSEYKLPLNVEYQSTNLFKTPLDNYPVFFTPLNELFDYLLAEKIFISHFAYPKPNDPPITRIVLSALHLPVDIAYLALKIKSFFETIRTSK